MKNKVTDLINDNNNTNYEIGYLEGAIEPGGGRIEFKIDNNKLTIKLKFEDQDSMLIFINEKLGLDDSDKNEEAK